MSDEYDMRHVAPTVCNILGVRPPNSVEKEPIKEVIGTMESPARLVVVVIDAFGISTWTAAKKVTPTFNTLANKHLIYMRSAMPTITPVNFATMLTGASPSAHRITDRTQELRLETIFDVLRENGRTSATAARAASSLGILISPFADRPGIAESNTDDELSTLAVEAIRDNVDLLWVQLLDVDDAGHKYGPLSTQGIAAVERADFHLREIVVEASKARFNLIALADHGQHTISREDGSQAGTHGTDMEEDTYVPFVWCTADELKEILGVWTEETLR